MRAHWNNIGIAIAFVFVVVVFYKLASYPSRGTARVHVHDLSNKAKYKHPKGIVIYCNMILNIVES
jgi:nitrous oxide reductase accessory protein NosL